MINVNFRNCEKEKDISGLWQYDYGRTLLITGLDLPEEVKVDFTLNDEVDSAIPRTGITQDRITVVAIPNVLLANEGCHDNYYIRAYIYVEDEEKGYTYRKITLRVRTRVKPGEYEVPDEEPDYVLKQLAEITKTLEELKKSGVVMELDATLTLEGKAADAKATGEAIQKVSSAIPAKTSDLQNDSDFQTSKEVQSTVNTAISNITHFHFEKAEELPETGKENVIYLVKKTDSEEEDIYEEYLFVDGAPELIGSTKIDLSGFALKTEIPQTLPNPKKLIFTGAVTAEYNGSEEKTIDIPEGGMTTEQAEQLKKNTEEINKLTEAVEKCIKEESDPTVPAWAKAETKPSYTASEVGADASGTAETKVSEHNTSIESHNDIRLLINGLTIRLNALADSDDVTLDQMSEVVAYIKSNKTLIEAVTTNKVNVSDIIDNLTTNVSDKPLSSAQGVVLKGMIDALETLIKNITIPETLPNPKKLIFTGAVTAEYDGSEEQTINIPESSGGGMTEEQLSLLNGKIDSPQTAEVGQVLSVKAVDENGKPTEWEVVDMASEDDDNLVEWELINHVTLSEDALEIIITEDNNGNPLELDDFYVRMNPHGTSQNTASAHGYFGIVIGGVDKHHLFMIGSVFSSNTSALWVHENIFVKVDVNSLRVKYGTFGSLNTIDGDTLKVEFKNRFTLLEPLGVENNSKVTAIQFKNDWSKTQYFGAGTEIKIYKKKG